MNFPNEDLIRYSIESSHDQSPLLDKIEMETFQKLINPEMISGSLQGRVLSLLSSLVQPNQIIEVGTFTGFSTICLAEGLTDNGCIHTIDINEELVEMQESNFQRSSYYKKIKSYLGDARKIIPKISGTIDLAFIDADKSNYQVYFDLLLVKMRQGGLIISDNTLWSGKVLDQNYDKDIDTQIIKQYNQYLKNHNKVQTVLLPFRDGLTLSYVL
ncbi:MAG: O-methyltransferase [Flavobacteriaceae bacterium]|nr:O-methyltransferase [Flavobacteriaceae bacterium]